MCDRAWCFRSRLFLLCSSFFFFFNDTATTEIYTLSLHDALPISYQGKKVIAGFKRASLKKATGGHYSIHLQPTNMEMAERSIGATLFAMGIPFWAVTGQVAVLTGK